MGIYRKYQNLIEKGLFPAILFLYPFLIINQGLDVADSTYSLSNFQYFGSMNGTWMVATFLSNAAGWLLMHLPFGETLLGMKCYTTLVQSATALMVYYGLKKDIAAPLLFLGEFLALGLCWCPSTILYNYLTYFFMAAAILLLYRGLMGAGSADELSGGVLAKEGTAPAEDGKFAFAGKQRLCFVTAGVCLGANVAVRMPNVVQAAFILAVWYGIVLICRRREGKRSERRAGDKAALWQLLAGVTGWCLLGYIAGFAVPLVLICIRYGVTAYPDMVYTMFAMTDQATDYKPASMVTGMVDDYGKGLYWLAFAGICAAAAGFAFWARERLYGVGENAGQQAGVFYKKEKAYKITGVIIKTGYVLLLLVLLRFYWGRGMFHFRYYQYGNGSMYYPAVLFILVTIAAAVYCLFAKRVCAGQKMLAVFVLLQIFLTPLGSNNDLYPIINNLFLAAPFLLWVLWSRFACQRTDGTAYDFVWRAPAILLLLLVTVQSIGSHANFVFQDGIYGEPRDMCVKMPEKAAGVYTNLENGALLEELSVFMKEEGLTGREVITYGELPGLSYLLDMPPALSTAWPDLKSYRMTEYERDLSALEEKIKAGKEGPVIVVSSPVAAYWSDDGEAISWFGVDMEKMAEDEKQRMLADFVRDYGYTECFGNARYVVYRK